MSEEGIKKTDNKLIYMGESIPFDRELFGQRLQMLIDVAYDEKCEVKSLMTDIVTNNHPVGGGA